MEKSLENPINTVHKETKQSLDINNLLTHFKKKSAVLETFDTFYNFQDPMKDPKYSSSKIFAPKNKQSSIKRLPNIKT